MSKIHPENNVKTADLAYFHSDVVDRIRSKGDIWKLPGGELLLPRVFGFCRGVKRAIAMLEKAVATHHGEGRLLLLGQIIHNPWVNDYFSRRGVRILSREELGDLAKMILPQDIAVIPAFGVTPEIERQLKVIGSKMLDTSCGDVRRLWIWAERTAGDGFGVMIFGRPTHDETMVTKTRLAEAGGRYVVVSNLDQVEMFCRMITGEETAGGFRETFGAEATNADSIEPFQRLAQVSQTTMLYEETMKVRQIVEQAFIRCYGEIGLADRLQFQPTVCRATQDRQAAAVELCKAGQDLAVVVGGFDSSNTRHLYELASGYAPTWFIEGAEAIGLEGELRTFDPHSESRLTVRDWLPTRRPLRIGILAGASCPEVVVGQVLEKLAAMVS